MDGVVETLVGRLRNGPPVALRSTKTLLNHAFDVTLEQALHDEAWAQSVNLGLDDVREAFEAFLAKREPVFRGR